ncbi:hypothetical protein J1605_008338 [Eschrichtius robustus]|uniref:Uncharacterized protein n=1 Tax=Eschrichtius robustus TaxID=9764 RepID=A0AB34GYM9_ESCRO|nr:hypothetical protein J1605_008338 [Eschrichtius robustus]
MEAPCLLLPRTWALRPKMTRLLGSQCHLERRWCQEVGPLGGDEVMRVEPPWMGLVSLEKETPESSLAPSSV